MARIEPLLALLLASACTAPAGNHQGTMPEADSPPASAGGTAQQGGAAVRTIRLPLLPPSRLGDAATTAGTLEADGNCLYLRTGIGERLLIAFTIPGISWDAAAGALVPGEGAAGPLRPGDRVRLGGSESSAAALSGKWVAPPAAGCDTRRIWVANSISAGI